MNAAILLKPKVMPGHILKLVTQGWPQFAGAHGPVRIGGKASALALHPNQSEMSPRRFEISVGRIKQNTDKPAPAEAVSDAESHQTATNNNDFVVLFYVNLPGR